MASMPKSNMHREQAQLTGSTIQTKLLLQFYSDRLPLVRMVKFLVSVICVLF